MSISEINEHVVMCSDAQKYYDSPTSKESSCASMTSYGKSERKERTIESSISTKRVARKSLVGHSLAQNYKEIKEQRSKSLQCLKKGSAKKALQLTLLKYLDSK